MNVSEVCDKLEPLDLQRLLRVMVRRIEWMPDGNHRVHYYLPTSKKPPQNNRSSGSGASSGAPPYWFETTKSLPVTEQIPNTLY